MPPVSQTVSPRVLEKPQTRGEQGAGQPTAQFCVQQTRRCYGNHASFGSVIAVTNPTTFPKFTIYHSIPTLYLQLTIPSHFPALTQGFLWELFLSFVQSNQSDPSGSLNLSGWDNSNFCQILKNSSVLLLVAFASVSSGRRQLRARLPVTLMGVVLCPYTL